MSTSFFLPRKITLKKTSQPDKSKTKSKTVEIKMRDRFNVAVSNTFTQKWEMQPYIDMANEHNYHIQIIKCHGDSKWQSIHNVP